jgi:hypothetical protein
VSAADYVLTQEGPFGGGGMLTDEEIKARLEGAFKPFRCYTKDRDYKHRLRFTVFNHDDQGIFQSEDIVRRRLRDESHLQDVIEKARAQIQAKAFVLT